MGLEGDVVVLQDLVLYKMEGEDENGKIIGKHIGTGIPRPAFYERARYYGEHKRVEDIMRSLSPKD
jgi:pilus assembly protein CpaF